MWYLQIVGGVAGLVYGGIIGFIKYVLLWNNIVKKQMNITIGAVYKRMGISYVVNFIALLIIFLARNKFPFDFAWALLGAAVAISLTTKLAPMSVIMTLVRDNDKCSANQIKIDEIDNNGIGVDEIGVDETDNDENNNVERNE